MDGKKKIKEWDISILTNKTYRQSKDIGFYIYDTEAHLNINLTDLDFNPEGASLALVNGEERLEVEVDYVDRRIAHRLDKRVMGHPGEWYAQVLYRGNGHTYTSEKLKFMVNDITKGMN